VDNALSSDLFRKVCGQFATGIAIACCRGRNGQPLGLTVNSFTSVSLQPLLVLFSLDHRSHSYQDFIEASHFSLQFLPEDARELSQRFARPSDDRFAGLDWRESTGGAPVLGNMLASMVCRQFSRVPAGDHDLLIGEVQDMSLQGGRPLLYLAGRYGRAASEE
jgi:4-hydroxyphenylacetate 3-hydroxylase, reductase component